MKYTCFVGRIVPLTLGWPFRWQKCFSSQNQGAGRTNSRQKLNIIKSQPGAESSYNLSCGVLWSCPVCPVCPVLLSSCPVPLSCAVPSCPVQCSNFIWNVECSSQTRDGDNSKWVILQCLVGPYTLVKDSIGSPWVHMICGTTSDSVRDHQGICWAVSIREPPWVRT